MINTRHLVQSAIAAAAALTAVHARQWEAERLLAEATEARAAARRRAATASAPLTVWFSNAAGACVASVTPEPKLVSRGTVPAMREVPHVRAA